MYNVLYGMLMPLVKSFYKIFFFAKAYGKDNVPKNSSVIVCSNHISNHDGVIIAGFIPRKMNFLGKKEIFKYKIFAKILYGLGVRPVDRSKNDISVVRAALSILKENGGLLIFPEGTRNLEDVNNAKDGAVVMALKTKTPLIPVRIKGDYRLFSGVKVIFGKEYDLTPYYDKKLTQEEIHAITLDLMKTINEIEEVR